MSELAIKQLNSRIGVLENNIKHHEKAIEDIKSELDNKREFIDCFELSDRINVGVHTIKELVIFFERRFEEARKSYVNITSDHRVQFGAVVVESDEDKEARLINKRDSLLDKLKYHNTRIDEFNKEISELKDSIQLLKGNGAKLIKCLQEMNNEVI